MAETKIARKKLIQVDLQSFALDMVDMRELTLQPGQKTGLHKHPCPVIEYILEGTAIVQIEGQQEQRFSAGFACFEPADTTILRFDNASDELPLRFIACYLLRKGQPLIEMIETQT
jgi:quercetin dioxygenase-like cupin family protein